MKSVNNLLDEYSGLTGHCLSNIILGTFWPALAAVVPVRQRVGKCTALYTTRMRR